MVGKGCQNVLFLMYVRFLRSTSCVKIFLDFETFSSKIRTAKVAFFVNFEADLLQNLESCTRENFTHGNR